MDFGVYQGCVVLNKHFGSYNGELEVLLFDHELGFSWSHMI